MIHPTRSTSSIKVRRSPSHRVLLRGSFTSIWVVLLLMVIRRRPATRRLIFPNRLIQTRHCGVVDSIVRGRMFRRISTTRASRAVVKSILQPRAIWISLRRYWQGRLLWPVVLLVVDSRRQVQVPAASIKSLPMCVRSLMVMDLAVKGLVASRSRYQQLTNPRLRRTRKPLRLRWHLGQPQPL